MKPKRKPKLVRDKIPEIIRATGRVPKFRFADEQEYYDFLIKKLEEEVEEFKENRNPDELQDILEVIYAIAEYNTIDLKELERKRKQKVKERGSFNKRIILEDW